MSNETTTGAHGALVVKLARAKENGRAITLSQDDAIALLADHTQLWRDRLALAKLARPDHPRGGFFNPIESREAQSLADRILGASSVPASQTASEETR